MTFKSGPLSVIVIFLKKLGLLGALFGLSLFSISCGRVGGDVSELVSNIISNQPTYAYKLRFSTQPSNIAAGAAFPSAVVVEITDLSGNVLTTSTASVTLQGHTNSLLSLAVMGTTTVNAVNGVATFPGLTVQVMGTAHRLQASSTGAESAMSNAFNVTAGAPFSLAHTTTSQTLRSFACSPVATVELRDQFDNVATATADTTINLSGPSINFYSDSSCSTLVTTATVLNGQSTANYYFSGQAAGTFGVTAASAGLTSAPLLNHTFTAPEFDQLAIITAPQTLGAGVCSAATTVQTQTGGGAPATVSTNTPIVLSGTDLSYFSDASCTQAISSINVLAGSNSASFYFRSNVVGTKQVSAKFGSLPAATQNETITPGPVTQIAFATAQTSLMVATCSSAIAIETRDQFGNASNTTALRTINLTNPSGVALSFYSDAGCTTPITSIDIGAGTNTQSFYVQGPAVGTAGLTASTAGLSSISRNYVIIAAPPSKLTFSTAPQTIPAGSCSGITTIRADDASNNVSAVAADTTVTLTGPPAVFYSDASCTTTITSITIPGGTSSASFYFISNTSGTLGLTASAAGLTDGTQNETITSLALSKLKYDTAAQTVVAGTCSSAVTVTAADVFDNPVLVAAPVNVTMTGASASFFSDAACSTPLTGVTISAGTSSSSFYFKRNVVGVFPLDVSATSLTGASQNETIIAAPPDQLAITSPAQNTIEAGTCSDPVVIQIRDEFGNPTLATSNTTVDLSAPGTTFYGTNDCSGAPITSVVIPTGSSTATVYFRRDSSGAATITIDDAANILDPTTQPSTVVPASANKLAFSTAAQTSIVAGTCSAVIGITTQDAFNNPTNVTADETINLSAPSTTFYSSSSCTGGTEITSVTIPNGSSSASFYMRRNLIGNVDVNISHTTYTAANQTETIVADVVNKIGFATSAQAVLSGTCSAMSAIEPRDQYDNPTLSTPAIVVDLSGPSATFYSDATCTTPITQITIASNAASQGFYFRRDPVGSLVITATAASLTSTVQQTQTINAGPPAKLAYTSIPTSVVAGVCSGAVTVEVQDAQNNPSGISGARTLDLLPTTGGVTYYTDSSCTTPVGGTSLNLPSGQTSITYSFVKTVTGVSSFDVSVNGGGITSVAQNVTITPNTPVKLAVTAGAAQTVVAGACSGAVVTVQSQDTYSNASPVSANTTVNLTDATDANATFFTDAACSVGNQITSVTIASGSTDASFYFKRTLSGTFNIGLTDPAGTGALTSTTATETINPDAAVSLAFSQQPVNTVAGVNMANVIVQLRDQFNNHASLSSANVTIALNNNPTTATLNGTLTVATSGGSATFSTLNISKVGTAYDFIATAPGLTSSSASSAFDITPAPAAQLAFLSTAQTRVAGTCSGAVSLETQDAFGNTTNVTADRTVTASGTNMTFFSDASCSTPLTGGSSNELTITNGTSAGTFYYRGTLAGSINLNIASTGLTGATQAQTINPDVPAKVVFTTAAQTIEAGGCSGITTVQSQDQFDNVSNALADTTVNLTGPLNYFTDATCTTGTTSVTLLQNTSTVSFYFKTNNAGGPTITASPVGLTQADQTQTIIAGAPKHLRIAQQPTDAAAGVAIAPAITVEVLDTYMNVVLPSQAKITFAILNNAGSGTLSGTVQKNAVSGVGTYGDLSINKIGTGYTLRATALGITSDDSTAFNITPAPPNKIVYNTAAQTVTAGDCSSPVEIEAQDQFDNISPVSSNTTVNMTGTHVVFYSSEDCSGAPVTALTIPSGDSKVRYSYTITRSGSWSMTATGVGITNAGTQSITVNPKPATQLAISTAAQTITAGVCSGVVTAQTQDQYGNASPIGANNTVNLTSNSAVVSGSSVFAFYSDASCTTPITSVMINSGTSDGSFYVRDQHPATYRMTATSSDPWVAEQDIVVNPAPANKLVFSSGTPGQTLTAGQCSSLRTVNLLDQFDNPTNAGSNLALTIGGAGITAYSDASCTTTVTPTIITGTNTVSYYFRGTVAGSISATASNGALTPASQTETINPDSVSQLAFSSTAQTVVAGVCSGQGTVQSQDQFGNAAPVTSDNPVTLTGTSVTFYSDASCSTVINPASLTILNGQTNANYYFTRTLSGTVALNVTDDGAVLNPGTQNQTINPDVATSIAFNVEPTNAVAGVNIAPSITVELKDQYGNLASLSSGTVVLSLDNNPTAATLNGTLSRATTGGIATFNNININNVGTGYTLLATSGAWTDTSASFNITPAAASKLAFTTAAKTNLVAGTCSSAVVIESQDAFNNPAPTASNQTVTLAGTGMTFFSDSSCSTPVPSSQVLIATGTTSATFYFSGTQSGTIALDVSSPGLTSASQNEGIIPAAPAQLAFSTPARTMTAGTCSEIITAQSQDSFGNVSNVLANTDVTFAIAGTSTGAALFSDASCSTALIGNISTIANGSNTTSIYAMSNTAGTILLTPSAGGLTSPSAQTETVTSSTPSQIAFASAPQTVTAGVCSSAVQLQTQDIYGNPSNVPGNRSVLINAPGLTFYNDAACTNEISTAQITTGNNTVPVYYVGTVVGGKLVTITSTGLTQDTQTETIEFAAASKLGFHVQPSNTLAGTSISPDIVVRVLDAYDNVVTSATDAVNLTIQTNPASGVLLGTAVQNAVAGVATFSGISIEQAGTGYRLGAGATGLTSGTSNLFNITPDTPVKLGFTTAPQSILANECSAAITVQVQDTYSNASPVAGDTTINLASSTGAYYSNSTCTNLITDRTLTAGTSSSTVYFKSTVKGITTLDATSNPLTAATQNIAIDASTMTQIAFSTAPQTVEIGVCSGIMTLEARDQFGNSTNADSDRVINLAGQSATFYSDAACTTGNEITTATILNGSPNTSVYYRIMQIGTVTVTAQSSGVTTITQDQTIIPGAPAILAYSTASQSTQVGQCSGIATVETRDFGNNVSVVTADRTVNLTSDSANVTYYSDSSCTTPITSLVITNGTSTGSFYFSSTESGSWNVISSSAGLVNASQSNIFTAAPAVALGFINTPRTSTANNCSQALTVAARDAYGNETSLTASNLISMTGSTVTFFSDSICSTPITDINMPAFTSRATFYAMSDVAGIHNLSVTSATLTTANQDLTVNPGLPSRLRFISTQQTIAAGDCSAPLTVQQQDNWGNPVNATSNFDITFTPIVGQLYTDASCSTSGVTSTITAGQNTTNIYIRTTKVGEDFVIASTSIGLGNTFQQVDIVPNVPALAKFLTVPKGPGYYALRAGNCSDKVEIQIVDAHNNEAIATSNMTFTLAPTQSISVFSDELCSVPITDPVILTGQGRTSYYFKQNLATTFTIDHTYAGLPMISQTHTINPNSIAQMQITSAPTTVTQGSCSDAIVVEGLDAFGNKNPDNLELWGKWVNVTWTAENTTFYSDPECNNVMASSLFFVSLVADNSYAKFYMKTLKTTSVTMDVNGGWLGNDSETFTILPGPASVIQIANTVEVPVDVCSFAVTAQAETSYNTVATVDEDVILTLGSESSTFYSDAACTNQISQITIANGTSSKEFYFIARRAGNETLSLSASNFLAGSRDMKVTNVRDVVLSPDGQRVLVDQCARLTANPRGIKLSDGTYFNADVTFDFDFTLSAPDTTFYSNASCTTQVTGPFTVNADSDHYNSADSINVYYKRSSAGSFTITATPTNTKMNSSTTNHTSFDKTLKFTTSARSILAGDCSAIMTIQTQDLFNNPVNTTADTLINLTTTSTIAAQFFSDSSCSTPITSITIPNGSNSASFYTRGTVTALAENAVIIQAETATTYATTTQAFYVSPNVASQIAFTSALQNLIVVNTCSEPFDVTSQDAYGNNSNVTSNLTVSLSSPQHPTNVEFYSDAACTNVISDITILSGQSLARFYIKSNDHIQITLNASSALGPASQIAFSVANKLIFSQVSPNIEANDCSGEYIVRAYDKDNNPFNVPSNWTIVLGDDGGPWRGTAAYTDSNCTNRANAGDGSPGDPLKNHLYETQSVTIPSGQDRVSFWIKSTHVKTSNLTVNADGFLGASTAYSFVTPSDAKLVMATPPRTVTAGICSPYVGVSFLDGSNAPFSPDSAMLLSVATSLASPQFKLFSDDRCDNEFTGSVGMQTNHPGFIGPTRQIWVKSTLVGTHSMNFSAPGHVGTSQDFTVVPGVPYYIGVGTPSRTVIAGECSEAVRIETQDRYKNASNVNSSKTVAFIIPSGVILYSEASCTIPISTTTIAANSNSVNIYFRRTTTGSFDIEPVVAKLVSDPQTQQVQSGTPVKIGFATNAQTVTAGYCSSATTVQLQDTHSNAVNAPVNLTVALSGPTLSFFSDSSCTTAITDVQITSGTTSASFYFKSSAVGTPSLTAATAGYTAGVQTQTIDPALPHELAITSTAQTVAAGNCSTAVDIRLNDIFGNPANAQSTVIITPAATGTTFYSDAGCLISATSVAVNTGFSTARVFFKTNVAGTLAVNLSAPGVLPTSQNQTITPGSPFQIAFKTAPTVAIADTCSSLITAEVRDAYGNKTNLLSATTFDIGTGGGLSIFSNAACTNSISTVPLSAGQSDINFYVRGSTQGTRSVNVSATNYPTIDQNVTITAGPPTRLTFVTSTQNLTAGTCSALVRISSADSGSNPTPVTADTTVNLTGANVSFFSDSSCLTPITDVTIANATTEQTFYIQSNLVGSRAVTVSAAGLTSANQNYNVAAASPTKIVFSSAAQSVVVDSCSLAGTVQLQDTFSNPARPSSATTVDLSSPSATFYSDVLCTNVITSVVIGTSSTSANYYFKSSTHGTASLIAQSTGLTTGTQDQTITPGIPIKLAITSPPRTLTAGDCSSLDIQTQDSYSVASNVASNRTINLAYDVAGEPIVFYSTPTCTGGSQVTSRVLASGSNTLTVYFQITQSGAGLATANITSAGLTATTQNVNVSAGAPSLIGYQTSSQTLSAGACSTAVTIASQDAYGNSAPASSNVTVNLSSATASFFSDSGCSTPISSVQIAQNTTSASFYFQTTTAGTTTISSAAAGYTTGDQNHTITANAPSQLGFGNAPLNIPAGTCGVLTVQSQDSYGNPSNVAGPTIIDFSVSGAPGAAYSDAACTNVIASRTINTGGQSTSFYFKSNGSGMADFNISTVAGLTSAMQTQTITALAASKLAFTSSAQTLTAGQCSSVVTVESQDSFNNPSTVPTNTTLSLGGTGGLTYYSTSDCSGGPITSVSLLTGTSQAGFYFRTNTSGTPSINVSVSAGHSMTAASQGQTINPAAVSQLGFVTAPQTVAANVCAAVTIASQDSLGNNIPANAALPTTVNLAASVSPLSFFSDVSCSTPATTTTIAANDSTSTFYFRTTTAGSPLITISSAGLTDGTQSQTITPLTPVKVGIVGAPSNLVAGTCSSAITIQAQDTHNNASNVGTNRTVTFTGSAINVFSNPTCTTPLASTTMNAGTNSITVYVSHPTVGTRALNAQVTSLTSATTNIVVDAAAPSQLAITSTAQTLTAGDCSGLVTVRTQDANGNNSNVASDRTISLGNAPLTFHTDSACSVGNTITDISILTGNSQATFYFKSNTSGTHGLAVSTAGLTSANQNQTINPGAPAQFSIDAPITQLAANTCSPAFTVRTQDIYGNNSNVSTNTTVNIASTLAGVIYSDFGCKTAVTNVTVNTGTSSRTFYFMDGTVENVTVTASGVLTSANQNLTVSAAGPSLRINNQANTPIVYYTYGVASVDTNYTFIVRNVGSSATGTLTVLGNSATPGMWTKTTDNCTGQTLAAGASCNVTITFRAGTGPDPIGEEYFATLSVQSTNLGANDGGGTYLVDLYGIRQ